MYPQFKALCGIEKNFSFKTELQRVTVAYSPFRLKQKKNATICSQKKTVKIEVKDE